MRSRSLWIRFAFSLTGLLGVTQAADVRAANPVFPSWYADPEGAIFDNTFWVYPTYSAPFDEQEHFDAFSSPDLVHWTKHNRILDSNEVKWAKRAMWAPAIVEKAGKYYLFFGANDIHDDKKEIGGIGVAVSDRPGGPFKDLLGKPLIGQIHNGAQPIDQFVFKDKDGRYYMVYGGWSHCNIARLNDDFTGFIPFEDQTVFKEITPKGYVEGPFMFLKDGKYFFMWSEGNWVGPDYCVAYAIADSPLGPFQRIGKVLEQDPKVATGAGHHSVIHVAKDDAWYIVYHRRPLGETDPNHRVTCIDRMYFDETGRIRPVKITPDGVRTHRLAPPATQPKTGERTPRASRASEASVEKAGMQVAARPRLVIVTPEQFVGELRPYIEHRRGEFEVTVATLEAVLKSGQGVDDPEKLKRFLFDLQIERPVRYVLLVGDASLLPVRYMVLDRVTPAAFDYAFYPSDLYYADIAKADGGFEDWNARKDGFHAGYFGEVRGEKNKADPINFDQVDYRPELAVGRWPVNNARELSSVIAKTIAFESGGSAGEACRAALIAVSGWVDARGAMDRVAASLPPSWAIEKRYDGGKRNANSPPLPSEKEIVRLLNAGTTLLVHAGHGTDTSWERVLFMDRLSQIHNGGRLPVMVSAGCSTARFATLPPYEAYVDVDGVEHKGTYAGEEFKGPPPPPSPYQKGRFNPPGLGKQLVVGGTDGAVAYFGCNTGSQPCGLTLIEGFVKAWGEGREPRLGDCWGGAVTHYFEKERLAHLQPNADWYPPSIFFQGMKFMLYGDPSLRLPR